jgi:hypothetical protein
MITSWHYKTLGYDHLTGKFFFMNLHLTRVPENPSPPILLTWAVEKRINSPEDSQKKVISLWSYSWKDFQPVDKEKVIKFFNDINQQKAAITPTNELQNIINKFLSAHESEMPPPQDQISLQNLGVISNISNYPSENQNSYESGFFLLYILHNKSVKFQTRHKSLEGVIGNNMKQFKTELLVGKYGITLTNFSHASTQPFFAHLRESLSYQNTNSKSSKYLWHFNIFTALKLAFCYMKVSGWWSWWSNTSCQLISEVEILKKWWAIQRHLRNLGMKSRDWLESKIGFMT